MRILAIGAHPDDIEFGCLGFLLSEHKKGADIFGLVLSSGEKGNDGNGNVRKKEQTDVFEMLGFSEIAFGTFCDGRIMNDADTVSFIETYIYSVKPDLILTHFPNDWHQDHANTSLAVQSACRYYPKLLYYHSFSTLNFLPSIFYDITSEIEQKIDILHRFPSQIDKNLSRGIDFVDIATTICKYMGDQCGVKYAEAFSIYRYLVQRGECE